MGLSKLLQNIPKGIIIPRQRDIQREGASHTIIVNIVGIFVSFWLVTIASSKFPVTTHGPRIESLAFPDYKTGTISTQYRKKVWSVDSI